MTRRFAVTVVLVTMVGCLGEEPIPESDIVEAQAASSVWMDPKLKGAKINANISTWRRDFEAQLLLQPRSRFEDPAITSISPSSANLGQAITITGTNFNRMTWLGQTWAVSFQAGTVRALQGPISMTNTQIVVAVPAIATTGRVRLVNTSRGNAIWAESALPLTINIPVPTTGIARFTNDTQFEVDSLTVNGNEQIPIGMVLPPGNWIEVVGPGANVPWHANLSLGGFDYWSWDSSVNIVNGQTINVSIRRVRAADVFTFGQPFVNFEGEIWGNNFDVYTARAKVFSTGRVEFYLDDVFQYAASYTDGAFNVYSPLINFTMDGRATSIDYPWARFFLENGPPSWPVVEYSL